MWYCVSFLRINFFFSGCTIVEYCGIHCRTTIGRNLPDCIRVCRTGQYRMCWYFLPEVLLHFYEAFVGIFAADFSKGASEMSLDNNKKRRWCWMRIYQPVSYIVFLAKLK